MEKNSDSYMVAYPASVGFFMVKYQHFSGVVSQHLFYEE